VCPCIELIVSSADLDQACTCVYVCIFGCVWVHVCSLLQVLWTTPPERGVKCRCVPRDRQHC
jgi:hypothetical protein